MAAAAVDHDEMDMPLYGPDEVLHEGDILLSVYRLHEISTRSPAYARERSDKLLFQFFFGQEGMSDEQFGVLRGRIVGALKHHRRLHKTAHSRVLNRPS